MYKILIKRYSSFDDVGLEFFSFELYIVASSSMLLHKYIHNNVVEELQTFFFYLHKSSNTYCSFSFDIWHHFM